MRSIKLFMSGDIRIKKGLSINIKGTAEKKIEKIPLASTYALNLRDFHLIVPKLIKKENEIIKRGEPIFYSKTNDELVFVSPVSGKIKEIVRGERRKILNIIIESDGKDDSIKNNAVNIKQSTSSDLKKHLLCCGLWPFIKQRPFDIIADPNSKPKSIHISCFDSAPLSVDFEFILKDNIDLFKTGLDALEILCPGNINIGLKKHQTYLINELSDYNITVFDGPHPSGNVGVQIHHINPINSGEVVWIVKPEDAIIIGDFISSGQYKPDRTIAVSGPPVENPMYFKTRIGCELKSVLKQVKFSKKDNLRFINGDVLSGYKVNSDGFLGYYNNNLSVLMEGNNYKLFGWIPFINNKVPSIYKTSFSWLSNDRPKDYDTNLNGEERAFVATGEMESVFPIDVYPMQLVKECLIGDIEKMEKLGIYEVSPEDFGLIDYSSSSKIEAQTIIREGLDYLYKETQ